MTLTLTGRELRIRVIAAALALIAFLGGCSDGAGGSTDPSTSAGQAFNGADVKFAQTIRPVDESCAE